MEKLCSFDVNKIPKRVNIATMTLHCKIKDIEINFSNIFDTIEPEKENIGYMEFRDKIKRHPDVKIQKTRSKKKSTFQNSMSIYVLGIKYVHVNFFRNGTIHITGAKSIDDVYASIGNMFSRLERSNVDNNLYVGDLVLDSIKISMINVNVALDYTLNKSLFKKILYERNIECLYNKTQNISLKYPVKDNVITIIIHMSSIIISRCRNEEEITMSYNFVKNLLDSTRRDIFYISVEDICEKNDRIRQLIM